MGSHPVGVQQPIRFGEGYELDLRPRRLRRGTRVLKLERIPMEILFVLIEHRDEIVTRDQIVSRIWGKSVFLDTDNSIRGAVRKLRQILKDDAETPRFIQTVTGQGYRFIAPVILPSETGDPGTSPEPPLAVVDRDFVSELDGWLTSRKLRLVEEGRDGTAEQTVDVETVPEERKRNTHRALLIRLSLVLACLVLLAVWIWRATLSRPVASQRKTVLAVMPFDDLSRDPDQEFFSDGLTEEMIAQLGKLNRINSRS